MRALFTKKHHKVLCAALVLVSEASSAVVLSSQLQSCFSAVGNLLMQRRP